MVTARQYNNNSISTELYVNRFCNGIKLERHANSSLSQSVGNLLTSAFTVYFLDLDGATQLMNDSLAEIYHLESPHQGIGKSIFDFSDTHTANKIHSNDMLVVSDQKYIFSDETVIIKRDNQVMNFLSLKYPYYNDKNILCGILGLSIALDKHPLATSLNMITNFGFLVESKRSISQKSTSNNFSGLTKREAEIMHYLARGSTGKQIASLLHASTRTIEHHIENIKCKVNVNCKSKLIQKYFDMMEARKGELENYQD